MKTYGFRYISIAFLLLIILIIGNRIFESFQDISCSTINNQLACNAFGKNNNCNWNNKINKCIDINCNNIKTDECNNYYWCSLDKKNNKCLNKPDPCNKMSPNGCFYGDERCLLDSNKCYTSTCFNADETSCKNNNQCMWKTDKYPEIQRDKSIKYNTYSYCRNSYDPSDCRVSDYQNNCEKNPKCIWNEKGIGRMFYYNKTIGACENKI